MIFTLDLIPWLLVTGYIANVEPVKGFPGFIGWIVLEIGIWINFTGLVVVVTI